MNTNLYNYNPPIQKSYKARAVDALFADVRPTHFITIDFAQGRWIAGEHGGRTRVRGDDVIYELTYQSFMRSLSKPLTTRTAWKYHRPILRSAYAFEGGTTDERYHLHMIVAKPDNVEEEIFCMMVNRTAAGNSWIMNGDHAVDIQRVDSNAEAIRATFYSLKRGTNRMCMT